MLFSFFLARELGRTQRELLDEIGMQEFVYWQAFFEIRHEEEQKAIKKAQEKR